MAQALKNNTAILQCSSLSQATKTVWLLLPEKAFSFRQGLTKLLPDYTVETTFKKIDNNKTLVEISHFYSISSLKVWLLNFVIKGKVAKETNDTLNGAKKSIENGYYVVS